MADLGTPYATLTEYKAFEEIEESDTQKDARLTLALKSASRAVEKFTYRQFNKVTTPSARIFHPATPDFLIVDDIYDTTGMTLRVGRFGGSFGSAWPANWYRLDPPNHVKGGVAGWPVERIEPRSGFEKFCPRDEVEVTALWGWAAVPEEVKLATLLLATRYYKIGDAALGVQGFKRFSSSRPGSDPVVDLLCDYRRDMDFA